MSALNIGFLAGSTDHPRAVGERIAWWCRSHDHKTLARMFGVEPRTAKSWRTGSLPQMRHLIAMAERWGEAFLRDVFRDVLTEADSDFDRRLERLEIELQSIRRDLHADILETGRPCAGRCRGLVHPSCPTLARTVSAGAVA